MRKSTPHRPLKAPPTIVVVGTSHGGVQALQILVAQFPPTLNIAVFIVMHLSSSYDSKLADILGRESDLKVVKATQGARIEKGYIYVAVPDYHLQFLDGCLNLSQSPKVNYHRPAVDVLFESAAQAFGPTVISIVLTGSQDCGTMGSIAVKGFGGTTIAQDPKEALSPSMPKHALGEAPIDYCVTLSEMGPLIQRLVETQSGLLPVA